MAGAGGGGGAVGIFNADGAGSGDAGLIGGGGNGDTGLIEAAGCAVGAGAFRGPDMGTCRGAIAGAGAGAAGAADGFAGALLIRSEVSGSPLGPKIPPTSSGTSTLLCAVRRGNCSGLSWATISGKGNSTGV